MAAGISVAVSVAGLALAPPASAVEDVTVTRLAGDDLATAADIAAAVHPSGADSVVVASGSGLP